MKDRQAGWDAKVVCPWCKREYAVDWAVESKDYGGLMCAKCDNPFYWDSKASTIFKTSTTPFKIEG